MISIVRKTTPALLVAGLLLAACAPAPAAELPTPAVSTQSVPAQAEPTEAMPEPTQPPPTEPATEVMPEPTEAAAESPTEAPAEQESADAITGAFVKGEVAATGTYSLDPATGALVFSDDFSVSPGPDLYVYLSGASDLTVDYVTFGSMVSNSAKLSLGALASNSGGQTYHVPDGTDLTQFNTVVIWCQTFSVEFAAAPLAQ